MPTLQKFSKKLKKILSPTERPFVCDGSPLDCRVFVVGTHPATVMTRSFWDFWNASRGFEKGPWLEQYITDRAKAPLKLGKTRRTKISNTRQRLNWVSDGAKPVRCLETNVYSQPTEALVDLADSERSTNIFRFLLKEIQPSLIVPYGKDARECLESISGENLLEGDLAICNIFGIKTQILPVSHLSRGWSEDNTFELGNKIQNIISENGT